jgi:hypothetical protein
MALFPLTTDNRIIYLVYMIVHQLVLSLAVAVDMGEIRP